MTTPTPRTDELIDALCPYSEDRADRLSARCASQMDKIAELESRIKELEDVIRELNEITEID